MAWAWAGTVVKVSDGDTITVSRAGELVRIRMLGIDAPETKQAFGEQAREALAQRCPIGSEATISGDKRDKYGRTLAWVSCGGDGVDANMLQVVEGWAWAYMTKDAALIAAEKVARRQQVGLWRASTPTPPWEWRKAKAAK